MKEPTFFLNNNHNNNNKKPLMGEFNVKNLCETRQMTRETQQQAENNDAEGNLPACIRQQQLSADCSAPP